jgi:hypothetical protein
MKQDLLQRAKERFSDLRELMREQHERMREDLRFSNPAKPEQWSGEAVTLRNGRPVLTFDHTNKFIRQVVNDGRASNPSIQVSPADSFASPKAAEKMNGRFRHIEYVSRAGIAYDTALELSARCGLGWLRVVPSVVNPETNQQEPRILRVHDPLSCMVDGIEPDGSDAECGFVLSPMPRSKFKRAHPKAKESHGWQDDQAIWTSRGGEDTILVCEYFEMVKRTVTKLLVRTPDDDVIALTPEEYTEVAAWLGQEPQIERDFESEERSVSWSTMTGCETLEETTFPSKYIPLVPVQGNELWVDDKRFLCGLTRQLMDGQRMHNAEMSSYVEQVLAQPKAPFMVPIRAIEGHEAAWKKLNTGNPAYLPYNDTADAESGGGAIAAPQRMSPPQLPGAFANGAMMAVGEMEAGVGMYKSSFGQESNAVSGRAKAADRRESDTATFHYMDNFVRSAEHFGRVVMDVDRNVTDTARMVRIRSEDGKSSSVRYDPSLTSAVKMRGAEVEAINPRLGEYDLRVKVGPSYLTQREETAEQLATMFQSAPDLLPVLGPLWVKLKDFPEADKVSRLLLSMAPEQVQKMAAEDEQDTPMPVQAQMAIQQMQQQMQQMAQALEAAAAAADNTRIEAEKAKTERDKAAADNMVNAYRAVTERLKVMQTMSPEMALLIQQTVRDAVTIPPVEPDGSEPIQAMAGDLPPIVPPDQDLEMAAPNFPENQQPDSGLSGEF